MTFSLINIFRIASFIKRGDTRKNAPVGEVGI